MDYVSPSSAPDATPSIREILLRLLARFEGASPAPATIDMSAPVEPIGPSTTPVDRAMLRVGPFIVLVDLPQLL